MASEIKVEYSSLDAARQAIAASVDALAGQRGTYPAVSSGARALQAFVAQAERAQNLLQRYGEIMHADCNRVQVEAERLRQTDDSEAASHGNLAKGTAVTANLQLDDAAALENGAFFEQSSLNVDVPLIDIKDFPLFAEKFVFETLTTPSEEGRPLDFGVSAGAGDSQGNGGVGIGKESISTPAPTPTPTPGDGTGKDEAPTITPGGADGTCVAPTPTPAPGDAAGTDEAPTLTPGGTDVTCEFPTPTPAPNDATGAGTTHEFPTSTPDGPCVVPTPTPVPDDAAGTFHTSTPITVPTLNDTPIEEA